MIRNPFYVVFGNEKGGTGKSTLAMHLAVYLLDLGYLVEVIDLDARQGTVSRYIHNRRKASQKESKIKLPSCEKFFSNEIDACKKYLENLKAPDFVIIDTPGNDTTLSRYGHSLADVLITPVNDSFVDLDVLVSVEEEEGVMRLKPSAYADTVWEQRKNRVAQTGKNFKWFVVKNRMGHLFTKNKASVDNVLTLLSKRIGFELLQGFGERVIFRELFLKGLTLLDVSVDSVPSVSIASAKQELRQMASAVMNLKNQSSQKETAYKNAEAA